MRTPPQPKSHFITGHLKGFKTDPIKFMQQSAEKHGDVVLFKLLHKKVYLFNHPEAIKHILLTQHENYHKSPSYKALRYLGGMGIFTSDGERWLKQRKLYQPAFSPKQIEQYTATVINKANELSNEINQQTGIVDVNTAMMKVTMSIISQSLFSQEIKYQSNVWEAITYCLNWISDRALKSPFVWPAKFPTAHNRKFHQSVKILDELVYQIIADKKKQNQTQNDLLERFMNPEDSNLKGLNEQELRDEVMTIFLAGHETSANVLIWALHEVAQHPEIAVKIRKEVDAIGRQELNYADLHQLTYTTQVIEETMRFYPPVWHLGRMNLADDEILGYPIPKGTHLRISPFVLHRHPDYWKTPHQFNPDHFAKEARKNRPPYTYIPFGAGPRLCAGRNFAMMEMVLILAKLVSRFDLEHTNPEKIKLEPSITLRPSVPILIRFKRR